MLEIVDVDLLRFQRLVGNDPIGELDDLNLQSFFGSFLGCLIDGSCRKPGIYADPDRGKFFSLGKCGGRNAGQQGEAKHGQDRAAASEREFHDQILSCF
ncbi:hypothetical protein D3C87_1592170 [compost metagenome]